MRETFGKINNAFKSARTALIVSHVDPDGDSIGSMISVGMILTGMGVEVDLYSEEGVPRIYRFLPWADKVKKQIQENIKYDLLISVDASDIKRLGNRVSDKGIANQIINIDHHPDNTRYGDINYVRLSSSTAELVFHLIKYLKVPITKEIAENLYVALITDTGNYRYENTSKGTFDMAGELIAAGVDTHAITTKIYDTKTLASIRVLALALSTMETSADKKAAWVCVTQEMMDQVAAKPEDLVGLVDIIRSIDGVEIAVLFRQERDKVKINFRSKEKINVSEIAKRFGGGGHVRASGAVIVDSMENAKNKVVSEIEKYIKALKYLV
jgi:bifunctional oligoribonuclease and PAP phosphatase NrnA